MILTSRLDQLKSMLKIKIHILTIYLFVLISQNLFGQLLLQDDFQTKSNYWFWRSDGNQNIPKVEDGLLHLQLKNAVESEYCNTEFYDPKDQTYFPGTQAIIRLKNSPIHIGSRGWGFWDGDFTINDILFSFDAAWVMQQSSDSASEKYNWSLFGISNDTVTNRQTFNLKNVLNESDWHTYKIIWRADSTFLFVDNTPLFVSTSQIPDQGMRFDVWIDNRVINISNPINFWNNNSAGSEMFVDYVEISGLDGPSIPRKLSGNLIVWDSPNTFADGKAKSLWKTYDFNTSKEGEALIFITGNAESYNDFNITDNLKIVLDKNDFGWNNLNSLDGNLLNGNGSTIALPVGLSAGNHSLEIHTDITPFVSDVIVLFSESGKVIYNKAYNQKANIDDGLWERIIFDSNEDSNISFLISGNISETNNLRLEIDDKDYGWQSDNFSNGDNLQSMPRTIVVDETLPAGNHSLNIYKTGNPELYNVSIYGKSTITDVEKIEFDNYENKLDVYPNPFNISTNISYQVSKGGITKISIYNSLGEQIKTLVNNYQNAGSHFIEWNADSIPSGIYFCSIITENFSQTKKLLLLK